MNTPISIQQRIWEAVQRLGGWVNAYEAAEAVNAANPGMGYGYQQAADSMRALTIRKLLEKYPGNGRSQMRWRIPAVHPEPVWRSPPSAIGTRAPRKPDPRGTRRNRPANLVGAGKIALEDVWPHPAPLPEGTPGRINLVEDCARWEREHRGINHQQGEA